MTDNTFDPKNTLTGGLDSYTPRDVIDLGIRLCGAVSAAVGPGGCHGGIWPGNISLLGGEIVLGEGFRGSVNDIDPDELEFIAPEQFWNGESIPASDVYSIGIILYTALNEGVMPYFEKGVERSTEVRATALQKRMRGVELPYPRSACRELGDVVLKAVEFRSENRYPDVSALAAALKALPESASIPAVAPVLRLTKEEAQSVHSYKVDKEFEEIAPEKPKKKKRKEKKPPDGVDEDMDSQEFRTTKKPIPRIIPFLIIIIAVAAIVFVLKSCREEPGVIPDPGPTPTQPQSLDVPGIVTTPEPTEAPPVETPTPTPEPTEKPLSERFTLVMDDVSWSEARELCEAEGGHLATVGSQEDLDYVISIAEEAGARFVWLGSYRGDDGVWYDVTGEVMSFAFWDAGEPSAMDSDGTREDYLLLWYRPSADKWAYNDMRDDPVSLLPRTYSGKTAYICEFD